MKISNRIFIIIITFIILISSLFSLYIKNTFANDLLFNDTNYNNLKFTYLFDLNGDFDNSIENFNELKKISPYIISVKLTSEDKTKFSMALRDTVQILKVFKGDGEQHLKQGDIINIFEPIIIRGQMLYANSGYIPMQKNKEYVLFLKDIIKPSWYQYKSEDGRKSFVPSSIFYGKFILDKDTQIMKVDYGDTYIPIDQINNYDLVLLKNSNQIKNIELKQYDADNVINKYKQIKKDLATYVDESNK
ncbi:hypothetical protein [Desulfosporosinus sp. FKB]|uniref:hypothetical protein n=1 Tax=Desulfosporosinus sp. FKB TaxID=1969835 RepID=UPI000B497C15|nr:hypothetical protein [Desulfosporosinus sp. FKB]